MYLTVLTSFPSAYFLPLHRFFPITMTLVLYICIYVNFFCCVIFHGCKFAFLVNTGKSSGKAHSTISTTCMFLYPLRSFFVLFLSYLIPSLSTTLKRTGLSIHWLRPSLIRNSSDWIFSSYIISCILVETGYSVTEVIVCISFFEVFHTSSLGIL